MHSSVNIVGMFAFISFSFHTTNDSTESGIAGLVDKMTSWQGLWEQFYQGHDDRYLAP